VEHFLEDVEDGRYDGFPTAGLRMVDLQNPAYRLFLRMPDNGQGARVDSVLPIETTREVLRPDDVILQVGDYPVGSDGSILFGENRVFGSVAFQTVQSGESIPLKILRNGRPQELSLPMHRYDGDRLLGNQYEQPPRYYIYAGLVFTPLSLDYLKTMGRNWRDLANTELVYELMYRRFEEPEEARPEPVVLCFTLASPANANIRISRGVLVDRINDRRIDRLEDVIEAFETATNSHHVMEFLPNRAIETLDRARAEAEKDTILETYGVQKDRRL
jgi:hypothetical protein